MILPTMARWMASGLRMMRVRSMAVSKTGKFSRIHSCVEAYRKQNVVFCQVGAKKERAAGAISWRGS
jgi:hypothetical protein